MGHAGKSAQNGARSDAALIRNWLRLKELASSISVRDLEHLFRLLFRRKKGVIIMPRTYKAAGKGAL